MALHAEIAPFTKWDRKNYYYPDLPKNYQISQYDLPFSHGGWLEIPVRKDGGGGGRCRLTRVHLEEDTGKLTHAAGGLSEVDLNRAGIPLLEIVTEPDIRSPADAQGCLEELRLTLRYLGVSDCEMQEGSLRCDANVNLHIHEGRQDDRHADRRDQEPEQLPGRREGPALRGRAAVREVAGRRPDDQGRPQDDPRLERRRGGHQAPAREGDGGRLPLLPRARPRPRGRRRAPGSTGSARRSASSPRPAGERFETEYGLSPYDANVLVEQGQDVADYYDAVARATGEYKLASNWIQQDVLRTIKEKKLTVAEFPVRPDGLADLINRVKRGELNTNQGREVLGRMIETGDPAEVIIEMGGYKMVSDRDAIAAAVAAAIAANPKAIDELKGGKKKPEAVKGFLRGQVMKQTGGKANPAARRRAARGQARRAPA